MSEIRSKPANKKYRENYDRIFKIQQSKGKLKSRVEIFDDFDGFITHSYHSHLENALINASVISQSRHKLVRVVRNGKVEAEFDERNKN